VLVGQLSFYDTNPNNPIPSSKLAMLEYEDCLKVSAWAEADAVCHPDGIQRFVMSGNNYLLTNRLSGTTSTGTSLTSAQNLQNIAAGQIFVACDGANSGRLGELFIDYTFELYKPGVYTMPAVAGAIQVSAPISASQPFSSAITGNYYSGNLQIIPTTVNNVLVVPDIPAGSYRIMFYAHATGAEATTLTFAVPTGATVTSNNFFITGGAYLISNASTAASAMYMVTVYQPVSLQITISGLTHLDAGCELAIYPWNANAWQ